MLELPFMKQMERMSKPKAVFNRLRPDRNLGRPQATKPMHFATGGIVDAPNVEVDPGSVNNSIIGAIQQGQMQPGIDQADNAHVNGTFLGMDKKDWLKAGLGALAGGLGSTYGVGIMPTGPAQTNPYAVPTINKTFNPATGAVLQHVTGSTPAPGVKTHFATGGQVQMQGDPSQGQGQGEDPGQQLLQAAVAALTGQIKDPNEAKQALEMFTQHFGQQALQELVAHVKASTQGGGSAVPPMAPQGPGMATGGIVQGAGDGMSDSVPAQHQGGRGIMLSNDEYVVPADAVSQLGNGSSSAGAAKLDAGVAKLRKMKYGRAKQPGKLKPNDNPVLG